MSPATEARRRSVRQPVRPHRLCTQLLELGDAITLHRRTGSFAEATFPALWLIGWTVGCVFLLIVALSGERFLWLFGVPFWAAWFFVAAYLVDLVFGRETLMVNRDGVFYERRTVVCWRRRLVTREDIAAVGRFRRVVDEESGRTVCGLRVETAGEPIDFGSGLPEDELRYLRYRTRRTLRLPTRRRNVPASERSGASVASGASGAATDWPTPPYRYEPGVEPPHLPDDSPLTIDELGDELTIRAPGRWRITSIGGLAFFNLFWNGIVSVFLVQVFNPDTGPLRIGLALFLVPFVVIGLGMFIALVIALLGPAVVKVWRLDRSALRHQWVVAGLTVWSRHDALGAIDAVQVDRRERSATWLGQLRRGNRFSSQTEKAPDGYVVGLIDRGGAVVGELMGLTHGEARWLADRAHRHLRLQRSTSLLP
jgi:hypothetical protein